MRNLHNLLRYTQFLLALTSALASLAFSPSFGLAQGRPAEIKVGSNVTPKIPSDACFYGTIHVKEIVAMPALSLVPWEILSAAGKDELGFDPLLIERLDVLARVNEQGPPEFCWIARTRQAISISPEAIEKIVPNSSFESVTLNDRFTLLGDEQLMLSIASGPVVESELKKQIARIGDTSLAWCVLVTAPLQKVLDQTIVGAPPDVRPDIETILRKTKMLAARFDQKESNIPVVLETASESDAKAVEKSILNLLQIADQGIEQSVTVGAKDLPERVRTALVSFHQRFRQEFQQVAKLNQSGSRLTTKITKELYDVQQMGTSLSAIVGLLLGLDANVPHN